MNNEPLISVIMPTYNRRWLLPRAINSVQNQFHKNVEIIVVNDAGEDVGDIIEGLNDPRIRYLQNEKNKGLAGTRNVALKETKGDYICLLDDDDIFLPGALDSRLYWLRKLGAEVVYTRSLLDHWEKTDDGYRSVGKSLYWDSPFERDLILIQNIAPCCNPLFSRKAWDDSGNYLFDEEMYTTEDHDFWVALSRKHDFMELKFLDAECSKRLDNTQMTGSLNFVPNWIKTFRRWRHTAIDLERVTESQNDILKRVGVNPEEYNL